MRQLWLVAGLMAWGLMAAAQDRDSFASSTLDSGFAHLRLVEPDRPAEEIIRAFAAKETQFAQALTHYSFTRSAKVETLSDGGKPDGTWQQVDEMGFDALGRRTEHNVYAPPDTLRRISIGPEDLEEIQQRNPFPLTTEGIQQYAVKYVGRQRVDEVDCYVFDVEPKAAAKKQKYFLGRVWVDATGGQIVVTNARLTDLDEMRKREKDAKSKKPKNDEEMHPPFLTWRQPVDGNWFPVYAKSEGTLHFAGGHGYMGQDISFRSVVKFEKYVKQGLRN